MSPSCRPQQGQIYSMRQKTVLSAAFEKTTAFLRRKLDKNDAATNGSFLRAHNEAGPLLRPSHTWSHLTLTTMMPRNKIPILYIRKWGLDITEVTELVNSGISIWPRSFWLQSMWNKLFCYTAWVSVLYLTQLKCSTNKALAKSLVITQANSCKELIKRNPLDGISSCIFWI